MARKMTTMAAMAAMAATVVTAMVPATAMAQDRYRSNYSGYDQRQDEWQQRGDDRCNWSDPRGYDRRQDDYTRPDHHAETVRYAYRDDHGYYDQNDGYYNQNRDYYARGGNDRAYRAPVSYGYRCQGSGTTGTIVGALAGGLLGNGLAGHGDRRLGTLLGGGAGAPLAVRSTSRAATADPNLRSRRLATAAPLFFKLGDERCV